MEDGTEYTSTYQKVQIPMWKRKENIGPLADKHKCRRFLPVCSTGSYGSVSEQNRIFNIESLSGYETQLVEMN